MASTDKVVRDVGARAPTEDIVQIVITKTQDGLYRVVYMSKEETVYTANLTMVDFAMKLLEVTLPRLNHV